ncbi:unnamed protein product [Urochloa decumbens]|uniref:rRNA N-glycosylase n=1 Tax=Urochloa decumbens TaxID=240449 RepID=A0ABC9CBY7_9POAL
MAALTPKFVDSFIVETDNYGVFIPMVRQNVIKYSSDRRPNIDQSVLPPEEKIPKLWFHVLLRTKASSLTLAIRMDNLYLVGFKTPGPAGVWWEFGKEGDTHLISKSANWLGFGGAYADLIGHQKGLEAVTLGRAQMAAAVDALAKHGTSVEKLPGAPVDPYAVPKMMLAKLVIMVCEGLRFLTVSGTVDKEFNNPAATITQMQGKQVNKWDRISVAVFKWAKDPSATFPDLKEVGVKDKNDAARIVALVKYQN